MAQQLHDRLGQSIGNTPLCDVPGTHATTKFECHNPSGSHYDRPYLDTLRKLLEGDYIRPGDELRDVTSGSAGRSLAYLGKELGFAVSITVPRELPPARIKAIEKYGAKVVFSHGDYIAGASKQQRDEIVSLLRDKKTWKRVLLDGDFKAVIFENLDDKRRRCYVNHSENLVTVDAFSKIGTEIIEQYQSDVIPHAVALAIGNWTSIAGITPVLERHWPEILVVGYQSPAGKRFENFGTTQEDSVGTNIMCSFRNPSLLDIITTVSDAERDSMAETLSTFRCPCGNQIGKSSLMGLAVAERYRALGKVVTISYDHLDMY